MGVEKNFSISCNVTKKMLYLHIEICGAKGIVYRL